VVSKMVGVFPGGLECCPKRLVSFLKGLELPLLKVGGYSGRVAHAGGGKVSRSV
jgi:hypothetical protein